MRGNSKKKKNNNNLIFIYISGGLFFLTVLIGIIVLLVKGGGGTNQEISLGEQQRQQVREFASQLIGNILDDQNNFNNLTTNPNGTRRNADEIEEIFLSNILSPSPDAPAPIKTPSSLAPQVIEQSWYELRIFLSTGLQNQNTSLLESIQQRVKRDIEKWLRTEKEDYNKLSEKYLQIIREVKTVQELFKEYSKARNNLVINKVDRSKELIAKGYSELDIIQLKEWNLLDQDFPNLYNQKRIGVTNALSALSRKYWEGGQEKRKITGGNSRELLIFLKSSNSQSSTVYFPPDKIEEAQQNSVRRVVEELIQNSSTGLEKLKNYDVYILRVNSSHEGAGSSSGVAHFLALYSTLNKIPLPRNLASTAAIKGEEIGAIGGLQHKLIASVKNGIDTFILAQRNESSQVKEQSYADTPSEVVEKIKQVHFISQVNQIETALLEVLKEPDKHIVHSCGVKPPEKPDEPDDEEPNPPNTSITPEQLLSLATEVFSRDISDFPKVQQDLKRKLMGVVMANEDYYKAVEGVLELRQKYLQKIQVVEKNNAPINETKEKSELDQLKKEILDFIEKAKEEEKNRPISSTKINSFKNEANRIMGLIKKNKWLTKNLDGWFFKLKEEATREGIDISKMEKLIWEHFLEEIYSASLPYSRDFDDPNDIEDKDYSLEKKIVEIEFDFIQKKLKDQIKKGGEEKEKILREYEGLFKIIASSTSTTEILKGLEKNSISITKIEWTGKLQAPSLNDKLSVSISLVKK